MRTIILTINIFFIFCFNLTISDASEDPMICFDNVMKYNMCEKARNLQEELAPQLPQHLSKTLILRSVSTYNNIVILNALLLYNREYLEETLKTYNRTMSSINAQMNDMTKKTVCSLPFTNTFVVLGGEIMFNYNFQDGESYLQIEVNEC